MPFFDNFVYDFDNLLILILDQQLTYIIVYYATRFINATLVTSFIR
jgi:hypothetical protein